ncbi:SGNH/GDSL hydrolase family protein [Streptomyces sp. NBC_01089]|uniref:SGNH/GDSL hydrolase family protein n=1 Tax=Streptomyces sp. NBC_01089 TaxID=2903747 RepID=UPI0038687B08|nr:SGNH/GDSL hydrolase family protein [Streptomyces sp. NBC_01089]
MPLHRSVPRPTGLPPAAAVRRPLARAGVPLAAAGLAALALATPATARPAAPVPAGHARAKAAGAHYVALGDSYSAGAGIPDQVDVNCARSNQNYPSLTAKTIGAAQVTDVTCSGADTTDMTQRQGSAPPQLDALRPDTTLVTLGIGGNDLDLTGVITRCVLLANLAPNGAPCKSSYTLLGTDEIRSRINATGPKIEAVLKEIHTRSPQAKVVLVGYPAIVPDDGSACRDTIPFAKGDFAWFRDEEKALNSMLAEQAAVYDAAYVDTYTPSVGHDACKADGVRWIEPKESAAAAGFHPNAAGHRSMAGAVLGAISR